jgi:protein involved in polysaccharide export with SLBB domain
VDFERLFVNGDTTQDVTLRNYDRIVIPSRQHTVYVFGQVVSPGHIPYTGGNTVAYYIDRAGGYTKHAREGDVVVIKASSRAWLDPAETHVEDGDYIWVPRETSQPFGFYLTTVAQLATVLASLATVILVIQNL